MLLSPSEDTTLSVTPHESFDLLAIQTFGPRAIPKSAALFEINSVLVKQVEALLFIICPATVECGKRSGPGSENTDRKYRGPSVSRCCEQ